ncbi:hypothetical protein [Okeania sp. SIO1I7]|uniref:hypothetical protein n=1 Tax=Okeania sp. SIO1I7 TaxID=2607772 RepID=UPI0025F0DF6E|nr:hypothetical protein [Okeania sp. SIO1I7]
MTVVLDASALLAYLKDELGSDLVDGVLAESVMSSVNWAVVVQKSISAGVEVDGLLDDQQALGLRIEPFTLEDIVGANPPSSIVSGRPCLSQSGIAIGGSSFDG